MERRGLLRGLATLLSAGTLAGCANNAEVPVTAPSGPLDIRGEDRTATPAPATTTDPTRVTDDRSAQRFVFPPEDIETAAGVAGKLLVTLSVRNRSPVRNTGLVEVSVGVGGQTYRNREFVTLGGGDETTVSMSFRVSYERYRTEGGSLNIAVTRRTPETPPPTDSPVPTGTNATARSGTETSQPATESDTVGSGQESTADGSTTDPTSG